MRVIILAAGSGSRLAPLTDNIPKCMVKVREMPIIDYCFRNLNQAGVRKVTVVGGYKDSTLKNHIDRYTQDCDVSFVVNQDYQVTNMCHSLALAIDSFDDEIKDDVIITYSDIVYNFEILDQLLVAEGDFNVVIDTDWLNLWSNRMPDPLSDVESLKIECGEITDIGRKVTDLNDVQGQYIGLIKLSNLACIRLRELYINALENTDDQDAKNMYLTDLIRCYIDFYGGVTPVLVRGGWLEIDSVSDLNAYTKYDHGFSFECNK